MQIAMPVIASDGKPYGIVIINTDMRPALDRVRSSVRPGETAYLVDRNGDYLIHPDRSREFGSQRGTPTDWRRDMPYFASSLGATKGIRDRAAGGCAARRYRVRAGSSGRQRMGRVHRMGPKGSLHGAGGSDPEQLRSPSD